MCVCPGSCNSLLLLSCMRSSGVMCHARWGGTTAATGRNGDTRSRRSMEAVEFATLECVDWFNYRRVPSVGPSSLITNNASGQESRRERHLPPSCIRNQAVNSPSHFGHSFRSQRKTASTALSWPSLAAQRMAALRTSRRAADCPPWGRNADRSRLEAGLQSKTVDTLDAPLPASQFLFLLPSTYKWPNIGL